LEISYVALIFCSAIGILGVLYSLHFRYRALVMGPQRLRNALSRTVSGNEEASDEELREGLDELESRIRRAILATSLGFILLAATCIALAVSSTLLQLNLVLMGICALMAAVMASLALLRDIPRFLSRHLAETGIDQQNT
jgi:hypothetical protein